MKLTSQDYSDIIRVISFNMKRVIINRTQVNKLLFMCYGIYMANTGRKLFEEKPKAWPYGPVFPIVYRTFPYRRMPISIPEEKRKEFSNDPMAVKVVRMVVARNCTTSAYQLSLWSHQEGSPWHQTVYGHGPVKWNQEIKDDIIKQYFSNVKIPEDGK